MLVPDVTHGLLTFDILPDVDAQIEGLHANVDEQRKEYKILVARLKSVEGDFRDGARDCMDANELESMIQRAYKEAQEVKPLQAIHDAHRAVESKAKQIQQTEGDLKIMNKEVSQLKDQIYRLEEQQHAKDKNVHACSCACTLTKTCPKAVIPI